VASRVVDPLDADPAFDVAEPPAADNGDGALVGEFYHQGFHRLGEVRVLGVRDNRCQGAVKIEEEDGFAVFELFFDRFEGVEGRRELGGAGADVEGRQRRDDVVRPGRFQRFGVADAVHADHVAEPPFSAGLHPGNGILEDDRPDRVDTQAFCRFQKQVRFGLSFQVEVLQVDPVDNGIEESGDVGTFQDRLTVFARRDNRGCEAEIFQLQNQLDRGLVELDSLLQQSEKAAVLFVPQRINRAGVFGIVGLAFGQFDAPRREKGTDPVEPRPAVHVGQIVFADIKRPEVTLPRLCFKQRIKRLFPCFGVQGCGPGHYSVEVEDGGIVSECGENGRRLLPCLFHDDSLPLKGCVFMVPDFY